MPRGGKRPGAGRPKKNRARQDFFEDAETYLLAVVQGTTAPDSVRVQAAKTLIAYQAAKKRAPVKSPTPSQLREQSISSMEKAKIAEYEEKAAEVRAKHKLKGGANGKSDH